MDIKIFTNNIEKTAQEQLDVLKSHIAFRDAKVRIMPDVHAGAGCVIGFTANLGDKVIPNIVGVDIGCGVRVVIFEANPVDLARFDQFVKENIPAGFSVNNVPMADINLEPLKCFPHLINTNRFILALSTLGGGNHFIELGLTKDGAYCLTVHTGSRNLGKQVADYYQKQAALLHPELPKGLAYLDGALRDDYLHDMKICQEYAIANRHLIADTLYSFFKNVKLIDNFESVHNYIDDTNMIRKGAISAHKGQKLIIPLNMRDGSIIGIGKGNEDWNSSAPHGAGRLMARGEARRTLQLDDFQKAMSGIFTTTANMSTIDEAPMAYKSANEIIDAISDTVEIIDIIKPIYNFKAAE